MSGEFDDESDDWLGQLTRLRKVLGTDARTAIEWSGRFVLSVSTEEFVEVLRSGRLFLRNQHFETSLYRIGLTGDRVILLENHPRNSLYCELIHKDFSAPDDRSAPAQRPLVWLLKPLFGLNDVPLTLEPYNKRIFGVPREEFDEAWTVGLSRGVPITCSKSGPVTWSRNHKPKVAQLSITIASSSDDHRFIQYVAESHKFGHHEGLITLLAWRANSRVAALIAGKSDLSRTGLRSRRFVFGKRYEDSIRQDSVTIVRVHTSPLAGKKLAIQQCLYDALESVAMQLTSGKLKVIEGVSHEFHPLAHKLGFLVLLPDQRRDAFYFWKNFGGQQYQKTTLVQPTREQIKSAIDMKKSIKYWLAPGSIDYIVRAIDAKAWAIRDSVLNRECWRKVSIGDIVFFRDEELSILAMGVVQTTLHKLVDGFLEFPLWITFSAMSKLEQSYLLQNPRLRLKGGLIELETSEMGGLPLPVTQILNTESSLGTIRDEIVERFNLGELVLVAADVGISYENLPGDTKELKAHWLLEQVRQNDQQPQLLRVLQVKRPNVLWWQFTDYFGK